MQQIGVDRKGRVVFFPGRNLDPVFLGIGNQVRATLEAPLPPGCDHRDVWLEGIVRDFKPHLVIAFAGCTMTHGISAYQIGDFDLALGDQGPGDRGAQQIDPFIERIGAEHRKHIIADEFVAQIVDEDIFRLYPCGQRFGSCRAQFFALA